MSGLGIQDALVAALAVGALGWLVWRRLARRGRAAACEDCPACAAAARAKAQPGASAPPRAAGGDGVIVSIAELKRR